MQITRYRWSDCVHVQHVNPEGEPMGWVEVRDPTNDVFDRTPVHDCPVCEDPEGTHHGISIMPPRPVESPGQATVAMNPAVAAFTPSQAMPNSHESTIDANNSFDVQHAMVDPYASTVSAHNNFDVQHAMVNPYSSPAPGENYLTVQQAMAQQPQGYEQQTHSSAGQVFMPGYYAPNSTMDAAPDLLAPGDHNQLVVFDPNTHAHSNDEYLALQRGYDQLQQFYSPAGQPTMPYSYGFTGPMGVAAFPPTHGPPDQLAAVSLHQASVESVNNTKNASKLPQHKPGNPCPEQNEKCHWHHTAWCHSNPKTCPRALQAITSAFHAHDEWKYAPPGWNEAHVSCIRRENPIMCPFHAQLARNVFGSSYD